MGFRLLSALVLGGALAAGFAAARDYQAGEVVIYHNPNDGTPPRKGRVTRVEDGKIWVDFKEFQPGLGVTDASKILWEHTNQVDDWLRPADAADVTQPVATPTAPSAARAATAPNAPAEGCAIGRLYGTWSTLQVGHTVTYAPGDGYVYQRQETAARAGELIIRPDHTFVWNSKSQGMIRGQWRAATSAEVRGGFGDVGIRLIHGESGWDYNVQCRPRQSANAGDSVAIWTSGYQVNGYRVR